MFVHEALVGLTVNARVSESACDVRETQDACIEASVTDKAFRRLDVYTVLVFPTRVFLNPKPGFFGYFLLPETRVFLTQKKRIVIKI